MGSQLASPIRPGLLDPSRPVRSLSIAFWLWKALLFLVVIGCPGPGYDTSTGLLPYLTTNSTDVISESYKRTPLSILLKFVRWDSIYYVHIAENGYVFEQEWAFGYGYAKTLAFLTSAFHRSGDLGGATNIAVVAIVLSHLAHYLSVLALYRLSINVFGQDTATRKLACFLSAALHIISPAGAFLSAPYGESLCSFLTITGFYVYSSSGHDDTEGRSLARDMKLLFAAVLFSLATTVRSNGVLSGILFAYQAVLQLWEIVSHGPSADGCVRLSVIIIGGCVVGLGFVAPQFFAYTDFCTSEDVSRPWCQHSVPTIYGWVQDHYWSCGFLRYWTVPNIPLFLLALPMLFVLCRSSIWGLKAARFSSSGVERGVSLATMSNSLLIPLSLAQGLLAVMAFTSYHVQIINRISSAYPLWYWYLVFQVLGDSEEPRPTTKHSRIFAVAVQGAVIYGLIQAILFGSFLPPA